MLTEEDFKRIKEAKDICYQGHEEAFELIPEFMKKNIKGASSLKWERVKYNDYHAPNQIPSGKKGIYAFVVMQESDVLPHHGYVMYIGLAGKTKNPNHGLRERYKNYVQVYDVLKMSSPLVRKMVSFYHEVLHFFYTEVDKNFSETELDNLETELIQSIQPPMNTNKKNPTRSYGKAQAVGREPEGAF